MGRLDPRKQAAALRFQAGKDAAPRVTAQGKGLIAEKIIEVARANGVHIQEDPVLISMLALLNIGDEIPDTLYKAVAEVLAFVYQVDHKRRRR